MKAIGIFIVAFMLCFAWPNSSKAQRVIQDSLSSADTLHVNTTKFHSPTKAALFSTFVPGLGQAYNKKYWKLPIIYVGIGTSMYFAVSNHNSFKKFKTAYGIRIDGDESTIDEYDGLLSEEGLKANVEYHQRNRDLSYIVAGLIYVFNIVDASVDAHLFNFPKNDNLSFNLQPNIQFMGNNELSKGFRLVVKL